MKRNGPQLFPPPKRALCPVRLEVASVEMRGCTGAVAWGNLHAMVRELNRAAQKAVGDVTVLIRGLRASGVVRLATPDECRADKAGVPMPADAVSSKRLGYDILRVFRAALKDHTTLASYVRSATDKSVVNANFSGSKLRALMRGEVAFPVLRRLGLSVGGDAWSLRLETDDEGHPVPVVELAGFRVGEQPGAGPVVLRCKRLRGRSAAGKLQTLDDLAALGRAVGWTKRNDADPAQIHKGALLLARRARPGCPPCWILTLAANRPARSVEPGEAVLAVHRGIANAVTAVWSSAGAAGSSHYPGSEIIAMKVQMAARGARIRRALAVRPGRGRGRRDKFRAARRIGDKERRAVDTAIWRIAKWVQDRVEEHGIGTVVVEDFGEGFQFSDARSESGRYLPPYLRRFPFAAVRERIKDAVTRRAGVRVVVVGAGYISQTCPLCQHTSLDNIARRPRVHRSSDVEPGSFRCAQCGLGMDLDTVAAWNLAARAGADVPVEAMRAARDALAKLARHQGRVRDAGREAEGSAEGERSVTGGNGGGGVARGARKTRSKGAGSVANGERGGEA